MIDRLPLGPFPGQHDTSATKQRPIRHRQAPNPTERRIPAGEGGRNETPALAGSCCICKYIGVFEIRLSVGVEKDLRATGVHYRGQILDTMEELLRHEPNVETRNRKVLVNLVPPFESVPPVWELRVGEYRVFYDIDEEKEIVYVRAVRHKPPRKTTKEIL